MDVGLIYKVFNSQGVGCRRAIIKPDKLTLYLFIYWIPLLPDLTAYRLCFILSFLASLGVATANHLPPSNTIPINLIPAFPLGHLPAASQPRHPPAHRFTISPRYLSLASLALSPKHCTWTLWWPHPWPPPSKSPPHKSNIILISAASSSACCHCPYTRKHCSFRSVPCYLAVQLGFLSSSSTPPPGFCSRYISHHRLQNTIVRGDSCLIPSLSMSVTSLSRTGFQWWSQSLPFDTLKSTGWITEEAGKSWLATNVPGRSR